MAKVDSPHIARYYAMVEWFDETVGELVGHIDKKGLGKDTIIIYVTDNGWIQNSKGRGYDLKSKRSQYDGGTRTPIMVRWPGKVPVGRVNDAIFATIDFMPTFANLCGFEVPKGRRIDGMNQTDLILGKRETGREYFYFNKAGVRKGKWKYLKPDAHFYGYAVEDDRKKVDELYDLEADLGERTNLAPNHPKIVAQLRQLMENISKGK